MPIKISGFNDEIAAYKVVQDTDSNATAELDVLGSGGRIYSIQIKNDAGVNSSYVKFKLTSGAVEPGVTEPDMMLIAGPSVDMMYSFPAGLVFNQLSFWSTLNPATSDLTAPPSTVVTILCS